MTKGEYIGKWRKIYAQKNVELLADAVGLDITVDETESSVGDFNVE